MQHATAIAVPSTSAHAHHLHVMAFLARYSGNTRETYAIRMRLFLAWCEALDLDPVHGVTRAHLEVYGRHMEEERGNSPSTVHGTLTTLKMFYRLLAIDQIIPVSPAEYVRMPKVFFDEVSVAGLTRLELGAFLQQARVMSPDHSALAVLLGMLGLRVSEACGVQVADFSSYERDHRVLKVVGKGRKPATIPLPPPVFRELDKAAEGRSGQLLYRIDGVTPLDRKAAYRMVRTIGRKAGIRQPVHPHALRHSFVTAALDAGVPLRDAQIAARHSDPRTTNRYDRARHNLDRHANHIVAAYLTGGA